MYTYNLPIKLWNHDLTYEELVNLKCRIEKLNHQTIIISFKNTRFIQANILAMLGCILDEAKKNENKIILKDCKPKIMYLLRQHYSRTIPYQDSNYILYQLYESQEREKFKCQLIHSLKGVEDNQKIYTITRILELFDNACEHSLPKEEKIYVSGYCNQNADWIYLSMGNIGRTFYDNMMTSKHKCKSLKDVDAILWGCLEPNSSKNQVGIGLCHLTEEIKNMNGFMWIISGNGYFDVKKGLVKEFNQSFNGTFITIGIPMKL